MRYLFLGETIVIIIGGNAFRRKGGRGPEYLSRRVAFFVLAWHGMA